MGPGFESQRDHKKLHRNVKLFLFRLDSKEASIGFDLVEAQASVRGGTEPTFYLRVEFVVAELIKPSIK